MSILDKRNKVRTATPKEVYGGVMYVYPKDSNISSRGSSLIQGFSFDQFQDPRTMNDVFIKAGLKSIGDIHCIVKVHDKEKFVVKYVGILKSGASRKLGQVISTNPSSLEAIKLAHGVRITIKDVISKTISADLVSVKPLSNPTGVITYFDFQ